MTTPKPSAERLTKSPNLFRNPDLPIGMIRMNRQGPMGSHSHDFTEIAIVESGQGVHCYEGTDLPVAKGDVFVVCKGREHAWTDAQDLVLTNVLLDDFSSIPLMADICNHPGFGPLFVFEPNLRSQQKGKGRLRLNLADLAELIRLIERLDDSLNQAGRANRSLSIVHLLEIVGILCDAYVQAPQTSHKAILRIGHAVEYLEANWHAPVRIEELAKEVHVSVSTLHRLFRDATGTTPVNYVNGLRVERACDRLRDTDDQITAIAFDVGFQDSNYFTRVFRKIQGQSPRAYRSQFLGL